MSGIQYCCDGKSPVPIGVDLAYVAEYLNPSIPVSSQALQSFNGLTVAEGKASQGIQYTLG